MDGVISSKKIESCFTKAMPTYLEHAVAQKKICTRLLDLLKKSNCGSGFSSVLEIGCGTGFLTKLLVDYCTTPKWTFNDLCDTTKFLTPLFRNKEYVFVQGDASVVDFGGCGFDLIASASTFQWIHPIAPFFKRLSSLLNEQGLLLYSSFEPGNMMEIVQLTGKGLLYPSATEVQQFLSEDFKSLVYQSETIEMLFDSPFEVLRHLKATGVTATSDTVWTSGKLNRFVKEYEMLYSKNGKVTLTYKPYYVMALKK